MSYISETTNTRKFDEAFRIELFRIRNDGTHVVVHVTGRNFEGPRVKVYVPK
jgi:hypothetical protein